MHWVLSAALYFDQFCARTFSAECSSARQASLSRPAVMAPRAAALQLGTTSSFGGLSASAVAVCSASDMAISAILPVKADMVSSWLCAALPIRWVMSRQEDHKELHRSPCGMQRSPGAGEGAGRGHRIARIPEVTPGTAAC